MPLFSYECQKCGHIFDLLIGMTMEKTKMECPKCQSTDIVKLISFPNISSKKTSPSGGSCPTGTCPLD
ncbi:MAG: zinc ribbon domain-containing protein [Candidatus Omnitrophica bacterium]|nr:zinc ribbon domain-containing protein [Candidatus Omnitrophota bacterium]